MGLAQEIRNRFRGDPRIDHFRQRIENREIKELDQAANIDVDLYGGKIDITAYIPDGRGGVVVEGYEVKVSDESGEVEMNRVSTVTVDRVIKK